MRRFAARVPFRLVLCALLLALTYAQPSAAADLPGVVLSVNGEVATIAIVASTPPAVGAEVRIFVVIPGVGEEAYVATARVIEVAGTTVQARIEKSTGAVTIGQQASIRSDASAPSPALPVPAQLTVPNVVGQSAAAAKATLASQGLTPTFRSGNVAPSAELAFTVYQQQPAAGSALPVERQVTLVLYGSATPAVPLPVPTAKEARPSDTASAAQATGGLRVASALDGATDTDRKIVQDVLSRLEKNHVSGATLNDQVAQRWFELFLTGIDPIKLYFTQTDVDALRPIAEKLDEFGRAGDLRFAYGAYQVYLKRVEERTQWAREFLSRKVDLSVDETYVHDLRHVEYPRSTSEARDLLHRRLKYDLLRLEADGVSPDEARQELLDRWERLLRVKYRFNDSNLIELYLTSLGKAFDSDSRYSSPESAALVNSTAAKQGVVGIEVEWRDLDFLVSRLDERGSAARQGRIQVGDRIIGIGEATGPIDDIALWRSSELIDRLRGEEGSDVRIQFVSKAGGEPEVIQLTREKLGPRRATSEILQSAATDERKYKIGYLELPVFYAETTSSENGSAPNSSTQDVRKLLDEFRYTEVDAVILDLRANQGGPVDEIVELTGLFLPPGPYLQSKTRGEPLKPKTAQKPLMTAEQFSRYRAGQALSGSGAGWSGPLVVLTSRRTVGGELFAAAIQDYGRGLIVGDSTTYGAGTSAHTYELGTQSAGGSWTRWGTLRITTGLLYRPNGESVQQRGVAADVLWPGFTDGEKLGMLHQDNPLPTEFSSRADYTRLEYLIDQPLRELLSARSQARREQSQEIKELEASVAAHREARARIDAPLRREAFLQWRAAWENPFDEPESEALREAYRQEAVQITLDYVSRLELDRAQRSYSERRYSAAWQQYTNAVRVDPEHAAAYHHFAWNLSTCPDAAQRDAARAVGHATRACELTEWKNWPYLLTLAVAHAQAGEFPAATERLEEALKLAPPDKRDAYAYLQQRFQAGQGYAAK